MSKRQRAIRKAIYRFKIGDRVQVKACFAGKAHGTMQGTIEKATYKRKIFTGGNIGYVTVKWDSGYTIAHREERTLELVK